MPSLDDSSPPNPVAYPHYGNFCTPLRLAATCVPLLSVLVALVAALVGVNILCCGGPYPMRLCVVLPRDELEVLRCCGWDIEGLESLAI